MGPNAVFSTIHESYCTILAKFYIENIYNATVSSLADLLALL